MTHLGVHLALGVQPVDRDLGQLLPGRRDAEELGEPGARPRSLRCRDHVMCGGTPGWDVRYVAEARSQGSGGTVPVEGAAVLQVTLSGVGYPTDTGIEEYDGSAPLPGRGTEVVTEVVRDSTFEGTSVAFVGTSEQAPFRVYLVESPARVVLDVAHRLTGLRARMQA